MKWRRRREVRTHLPVWPVVLAPFLTESCVGERFWVEKIREGNVFLSFSLLFFSLGHFHVIDRRSRREEEEKSAKKQQQQWRRERAMRKKRIIMIGLRKDSLYFFLQKPNKLFFKADFIGIHSCSIAIMIGHLKVETSERGMNHQTSVSFLFFSIFFWSKMTALSLRQSCS